MSNNTCPSEMNIVLKFPRPPEGPKMDFGTFIPLARVKRIMKSDSDVRMIAQEAPVILARACELLTLELTLRAAKEQEHAKLITRADIVRAIKAAPTMDFLHGVVCPA